MEARSKTEGDGFHYETRKSYSRNGPNGSWILKTSKPQWNTYEYQEMLGFDIPNFHKRKREGELLPYTPFSQFKCSGSVTGDYVINYADGSSSKSDNYHGLPESLVPTREFLQNEMDQHDPTYFVQAAAAAIYGSGFDSLTFAAELKSTVRLFKGLLRRFIRLVASGRIEKIWLEGRYGWAQLANDIINFNNTMTEFDSERKRYSERVGTTTNYTTTSTLKVFDWYSSAAHWVNVSDTYTIGLRGSVTADIEPPKFIFNPILTGWELLTLSFVVDWFINIGQWLESMSFRSLSSSYTAASGMHVSMVRNIYNQGTTYKNGVSGDVNTLGLITSELTVRNPASVSNNPLIKLRLDAFKITDLLALLRQRLRSK